MESRGIFQTSSPFLHFKRVTSLFEIECRSVCVLFFFFNCYKCTLHLFWRIRCYWKEWFKRITKNTLKSFSLIQILLSTIIIFQKITFRSYSFANNKLFITNLINVFRRMSISEISIFIEGISMRRRSLSSPIPEWYSRTRVSTFSRT